MTSRPADPAPAQACWKLMSRFEEAAGETAAECAAVLCCCPCGLANLLLAAAIKLPAGLLWQAVRRRRKRYRRRQKAGLSRPRVGFSDDGEDDLSIHGGLLRAAGVDEAWAATRPSQEMLELGAADVGDILRSGILAELFTEGVIN